MNPEQYSRFTHAASALVSQHDRLSTQAGAVARNVASERLRAFLSPFRLVLSLIAMAFAVFLLSLPLYATHLFAPYQMYHSVRASITDVEETQAKIVNVAAWEPAYHTFCRYTLSYKEMGHAHSTSLTEEKVRRFSFASCRESGDQIAAWIMDGRPNDPRWEPPGLPWGAYLSVVILGAVTLTVSTRFAVAWLGVSYRASRYAREAKRIIQAEGTPRYLDVVEETAGKNFDRFLDERKRKPKKFRQYGNRNNLFM